MAVLGTYHHVHLISREPDRTANWYVAALEGKIQHRAWSKDTINIRLKVGDANLSVRGIRPGDDVADPQNSRALGLHHLGLMVDDIEAAIRQVVENDGSLIEPIQTGSSGNLIAFVQGPDNVLIELLQPKK